MPPQTWTLTTALPPLLTTTLAPLLTLLILARPPHQRLPTPLLTLLPLLLTLHALTQHTHLTPWPTINDTLARTLYIWAAHVSYLVFVLRVDIPPEFCCKGWGGRVAWARRVMVVRRVGGCYTFWRGEREAGARVRVWFALVHGGRAVLFLGFNAVVDAFVESGSGGGSQAVFAIESDRGAFLHRLFAALASFEQIRGRLLMVWDVCVADMLYLSAVYSLVAVLWVCVLRFDGPEEWDRALFGSLADCWSVRRYWGVYWHDYVRESFSAHVRLFTRRVCGWRARGVGRRVVENWLVFGVSGLAHSWVRYVQTEGEGEVWTVALWYAAQMLPIMVEGVVQHVWGMSRLRVRAGRLLGEGMLVMGERTIGYCWVFAWMFWSVPKYLLTRHAWEMDSLRRTHPELFSGGRVVY